MSYIHKIYVRVECSFNISNATSHNDGTHIVGFGANSPRSVFVRSLACMFDEDAGSGGTGAGAYKVFDLLIRQVIVNTICT